MGKQLSHSRNSPSHRPGGKPYKVAGIEPEVYDVQYKTFNPTAYDPDAIVKLAKRAGMRYLVFTAKHHAGFSMFDSAVSDYDIMSTPYGKNLLKELEQACRRHDFNFGFYYSPRDWHHPDCDSEHHHDRYIAFYKAQMGELLSNYGPIYEIWFDGLGPGNWGSTAAEVMRRIRVLHPNAMVNDRGGAARTSTLLNTPSATSTASSSGKPATQRLASGGTTRTSMPSRHPTHGDSALHLGCRR